MKQRGILFTGEMITAIVNGSKTETRRLSGLKKINESPDDWEFIHLTEREGDHFAAFKHKKTGIVKTYRCPFGKTGDILHIQETFCQVGENIVYKADGSERLKGGRWAPGWFMPYELSRYFIQNDGVKIERLNDITDDAAIAEGFQSRSAFFKLFESVNGEIIGNPWIFVLKFFLSSYKVNVKFTENG